MSHSRKRFGTNLLQSMAGNNPSHTEKGANVMTEKEIIESIRQYAVDNDMNAIEIMLEKNGYTFHHEAMAHGYVTRKTSCTPLSYNGRFGRGIILEIPAYRGTQYHYRQYWIKTA